MVSSSVRASSRALYEQRMYETFVGFEYNKAEVLQRLLGGLNSRERYV